MNNYIKELLLKFKYIEDEINDKINILIQDNKKFVNLSTGNKIDFIKTNLIIPSELNLEKESAYKNSNFMDLKKIKYSEKDNFSGVSILFNKDKNEIYIKSLFLKKELDENIELCYCFDIKQGISINLSRYISNDYITLYFEDEVVKNNYKSDFYNTFNNNLFIKKAKNIYNLIDLLKEKEKLTLDYLFSNKIIPKDEIDFLNLTKDLTINLKNFEEFKLDLDFKKNIIGKNKNDKIFK